MAAAPNESVDVTKGRTSDDDKSDAFSILAHDVKTPVTSIRMTLHMLLEEKIGALTADQRELIEAAREDCEHMLTTIPSLLELARFQNDRVKPKLQPTSPVTLLQQAGLKHEGDPRRKDVLVLVTVPPEELPLVDADSVQIGRVLENFISSAAKSGGSGHPVMLSATVHDDFVRLSVRSRDERLRSGIEDAHMIDFRGARPSDGAAFGLKLCSEIARLHGGRIGVGAAGEFEEYYLDLRRS